jgi:GntR family transcriptional repressor for pyruvate dehydrogenase complex
MTARAPKAAQRLAREIVATIAETGMRPGDRYLNEADALKRHGVARSTYREALRYLEIQGVVDMRVGPGGGAEIRQPGPDQLASGLALLLQFADAPLRSVLEARRAIEPGMAEMAARAATGEDLAAMGVALADIDAALGDYPRFAEAYHRFWTHFAVASHNPVLALLGPALRTIVDSAGFVPNEPYRSETLGRLRRVHDAIADHDEAAARTAMLDVDLAFLDRLTAGYPRRMEQVVSWSDLTP